MGRAHLFLIAAVLFLARALAFDAPYPEGHRTRINGYTVLHLAGNGKKMGERHAHLAGRLVRQVLRDVILEGEGSGSRYDSLIRGAMVMERYLPDEYRAELKALAAGCDVKYQDIVALQLFGDVQRGQRCTSFATFGDATASGECSVGRNMDFWDHGASKYAAMIIHYTPDEGIPFMTVTWAGIINGWTAMNHRGIVCANNSAYGGRDSIEGLSTCFMVRKVAQFARTVEEGVRIVQHTPRACGTNLLIAGGNPPKAAIVEFDHERVAVRWAKNGFVAAANEFRALGRNYDSRLEDLGGESARGKVGNDLFGGYYWISRDELLVKLIRQHYGRIDESTNLVGAEGVPIRSINLHSALLFPDRLAFRVSMSEVPAADQPYRRYRMTDRGIVSDE